MLQTQAAIHQTVDEKFDTDLVEAKRPPCIGSDLGRGEVSTTIIPAPKIWRRKQSSFTKSMDFSSRRDGIDVVPGGTSNESAAVDLDEWSRDFLLLVELND